MTEVNNKIEQFVSLVTLAFGAGAIKKLVFSRPRAGEEKKVTARLVKHKERKILACEYALPGDTVRHKNFTESELSSAVTELASLYMQSNLITPVGEAELKSSKSGKITLLGGDRLVRALSGEGGFEAAEVSLDTRKNYILQGDEDFLISLGISDKSGRVHDKKQGKFRQINRFLEHIEDISANLPREGELIVYDLCCGKSYLSFAVYYYLTAIKNRSVSMLGIDLKRDVINWCQGEADRLGYSGMRFVTDDIKNLPRDLRPHLVISLHACDIATDIVIDSAISLGAGVILSTPCCHRYLNGRLNSPELEFVSRFPHLRNKLCEAITDAIRLARLEEAGYKVAAKELTDPDDTPKNTLIEAVYVGKRQTRGASYDDILTYVLGEGKDRYLKDL